jgi:uncharacterized membrane protein YgdD (TMEM256/DUF423 family)
MRYDGAMSGVRFVFAGALNAFLAVAMGAFGAHLLDQRFHIEKHYLDVWKTGVQYHLFHALALLYLGSVAEKMGARLSEWIGALFAMGMALFCGSLYLLAITSLQKAGALKWLGMITPAGGVCFLSAWALLAWAGTKKNVT